MTRYKLDIQKRQHKERSQPLNRQRLGLLEKHKDYVKRARDYHSKQDRIKKLREKAALKNPDEFYFEMIKSSTDKGVHVKSRGNKALDNDLVELLKSQDFGYVKTCRAIEEKKVDKLKEQLGSMVNAMPMVEDEGSMRQNILNLIQQGTSAISSTHKDDDQSASEDEGPAPPRRKKTIFVDSIEKVREFSKNQTSQKQLVTPSSDTIKGKSRASSAEETANDPKRRDSETEAHMNKLASTLKSRLTRLRALQRAERELELKRALMGNGSKFLKHGASHNNKKALPDGRDLSWYDKLDRNELIEEKEEKERLEKLNSGIKTGAQVWKWKAERKR